MTLDMLKSEVLKLLRVELLDFVQFILQSLKEKETAGELQTPEWLKAEISRRAAEMNSIVFLVTQSENFRKYMKAVFKRYLSL